MRHALRLGLVTLALSGAACKTRPPTGSAVKADDGAAHRDADAKGEAAEVAKACSGSASTAFRGVGDGTVVEFSNLGEAGKGEGSGQRHWNEEATFDGRFWALSATINGGRTAGECLKASRILTTRQLIAALGCSSENPCEEATDACAGGGCPALAQVDFKATEADPEARLKVGIALTGSAVRCDGAQLKTAAGQPIGAELQDPAQCESLQGTASHGLVCAWNGKAFVPARTDDGVLIGVAGGGVDSPGACHALVVMGAHEAVCSWSGAGLAPFAIARPEAPIGAPEQYGDALHCLTKTAAVAGGRICSWDGRAVRAFSLQSGAPLAELGEFPDYPSCFGTLTRAASPKGMAELEALAQNAATPDPAATKGGGGLNLAGNAGWTWTDCNDASRAYHLTARSGSQLVCQGKIDTLYSWGPEAKISWLSRQPWTGRLARDGDGKELFATQSSFATHGYGPYAIRIKLKPDVRFKFMESVAAYSICDEFSYSELENTVAMRYWANAGWTGLDFVLCGLGPVHSWSYGTQGHYDEMNREATWISANNYKNYELYVKRNAVDDVYPANLDGCTFSGQVWTNNLAWHRYKLPGAVYFNPTAPNRTNEEHFSTAWPNYINPNESAAKVVGPAVGVAAKSGDSRRFAMNFSTGNQQQRDVVEAQLKVILDAAAQKGVPMTCANGQAVGWALQKLCTTDGTGAILLTSLFPVLDYHGTIQEY